MARQLAAMLILGFVMLFGLAPAAAQTGAQRISVDAPRRVMLGEPFELSVKIHGARSPTAPDLSGLRDFSVAAVRSNYMSNIQIINGRMSPDSFEGYVFVYQLVATRAGTLRIPSLSVRADGETLSTEPIDVTVTMPAETDEVLLRMRVSNDRPYVGEPVELTVEWLTARVPSNVTFTLASDDSSFQLLDAPTSAATPGNPIQLPFLGSAVNAVQGEEVSDGRAYYRFTIQRIVVPRQAGRIELGPMSVTTNLILRQARSLFERDETRRYTALSDPITLDVRPLPSANRPPNFSGLIGAYSVDAHATPRAVNVGDPITLRVTVSGPLSTSVLAPQIDRQPSLAGKFRVSEQVLRTERGDGSVEFVYTIRAMDPELEAIPPIELPYFDTQSGAYATAMSPPVPIRVSRARVVTAADAISGSAGGPTGEAVLSAAPGIRHNYVSPDALADQRFSLVGMATSPGVLAAIAAPPAAFACASLLVLMRSRRATRNRDRRRTAATDARRTLTNPQSLQDPDPLGLLARTLQTFVADLFERPSASLTPAECAELVTPLDPEAAERLRAILTSCDAARFAGSDSDDQSRLYRDALDVIVRIDERMKGNRS